MSNLIQWTNLLTGDIQQGSGKNYQHKFRDISWFFSYNMVFPDFRIQMIYFYLKYFFSVKTADIETHHLTRIKNYHTHCIYSKINVIFILINTLCMHILSRTSEKPSHPSFILDLYLKGTYSIFLSNILSIQTTKQWRKFMNL